jgi:hypothetical protein
VQRHDYRLEREFISLVDVQVLREFSFLRESFVHTPDPFDLVKIAPAFATIYAYAIARDSVRVYFLTDLDVNRGNVHRSGWGRVVDPITVGYLGRPAADITKRRAASARAAAVITGKESSSWLDFFRRRP